LVAVLGLVPEDEADEVLALAARVGAMLTRLVQRHHWQTACRKPTGFGFHLHPPGEVRDTGPTPSGGACGAAPTGKATLEAPTIRGTRFARTRGDEPGRQALGEGRDR